MRSIRRGKKKNTESVCLACCRVYSVDPDTVPGKILNRNLFPCFLLLHVHVVPKICPHKINACKYFGVINIAFIFSKQMPYVAGEKE